MTAQRLQDAQEAFRLANYALRPVRVTQRLQDAQKLRSIMKNIRISERHGVNPSVGICFFCGEGKEVILFGRMREDAEAPREVCLDKEPCQKCADFMKQGIILIGCDEAKSAADPHNPYRDGNWAVVTEDYVRRAFTPEMAEVAMNKRACFVGSDVWKLMGLPTQRVTAGPNHKNTKVED